MAITATLSPVRKRRRRGLMCFIARETQLLQLDQERFQQRGQTKRRHSWQKRNLSVKAW